MQTHPSYTARIVDRHRRIATVVLLRCYAQIVDTVVIPNAIDVVNPTLGPFTEMDRPSDTVRQETFAIDTANMISGSVGGGECFFAS
jgi:hypothetical protein